MTRRDRERLADILAAIEAVHGHVRHGGLDSGLVFDAVRVRLIEIGEAVKGIDPETLALMPEIPWSDVARMRDHLAHRYFDTTHAIVRATVENGPRLVGPLVRLPVNPASYRRASRANIRCRTDPGRG